MNPESQTNIWECLFKRISFFEHVYSGGPQSWYGSQCLQSSNGSQGPPSSKGSQGSQSSNVSQGWNVYF